jgi:hypothetical protein
VEFDPAAGPTGKDEFLGPGRVAAEKIIGQPDWEGVQRVDNLLWARKTGRS